MKKIIMGILITIIYLPAVVQAKPIASISAPSSVEVGNKITAQVTLKNTAAWNIKIISSGSTSGCSQTFVGDPGTGKDVTKTLSVTCKATGIGAIAFTVTGDITSATDKKNPLNVSLNKRVTVTQPREKSKDATLSSLSIEGYELSPIFNRDTLEYNVTLPPTVNTIKIAAKVNESHASVIGEGEFEVSDGINTFSVIVTAENGTQKTYVLNVMVEDINPIEIQIDGKKYTIIKNAKNLTKPELYEDKTIKIGEFDIPSFYSSITKFTLVGIKDENGIVSLAIYNNEKNEYQLYHEYTSNNLMLYLTKFPNDLEGYQKSTININDTEIEVYRLNENSRFVIVYGMNIETGKYDYYSYDTKENTYQIYNDEEINSLKEDVKTYLYVCIAFGSGLLFAFILIICLLSNKNKKRKKLEMRIEEKKNDQNKVEEPKETKKTNTKNKDEVKNEEIIEEKVIETTEDMHDLLKEMQKQKKKKNAKN